MKANRSRAREKERERGGVSNKSELMILLYQLYKLTIVCFNQRAIAIPFQLLHRIVLMSGTHQIYCIADCDGHHLVNTVNLHEIIQIAYDNGRVG